MLNIKFKMSFDMRKRILDCKICIREASPGGGYFISSSSETAPKTLIESVLTF